MIKKVRVEDAIGKTLLHDITAIKKDGFKGVLFKRGHVIGEDDIERLKDIGKDNIYVGSLDKGLVHEEDAIGEVAHDLAGENVSLSGVSEGKISFISDIDGLFEINREELNKLNERGIYTFASLKSYTQVKKGEILAGGRIVPLYTSENEVAYINAISKEYGPCFRVRAYKNLRVGVIITGNEIYYGRIKDMFEPVIREKLKDYDHELLEITKSPDDINILEAKARDLLDKGCDLVVFSGGMSVDPDDLTPSVIKKLSDDFIIQGLPVQPGNMLTVGRTNKAYLVGVPGASIHAKFTSFDIFLPRIFAGIELKKSDFTEMGEGGLLKR